MHMVVYWLDTMQIAPMDEEAASLKAWCSQAGNDPAALCRPEQWLLAMSNVPRLKVKLAVLSFKSQSEMLLADAKAAVELIKQACNEASWRFR